MSYNPSPVATSSRKVARNYVNGSGGTLLQGAPLSTLTNGNVTATDVSSQISVDSFVGFYNQDTVSSASGLVIDCGILEDLGGYGFSVGDPVYISTIGNLTNVIPSIGVGGFVSGDYVVFCGVVIQNEFDNLQQDLKILIVKVGTL